MVKKNNLVHFCVPFIKQHMVKGYSFKLFQKYVVRCKSA